MHLGCPVRYVEAAERFICPCHGGVYNFRGAGRRRPAGPPARPLLHARARRLRLHRPALRGQLRARSASPRAIRPSRSTGSASSCTRRAGAPRRCRRSANLPLRPQFPAPSMPSSPALPLRRTPPRPTRTRRCTRRCGDRGRHARRRLDRRAHLAVARHALDAVPQGPEGHQLGLHARFGDAVRVPQPGGDRRLPGDVLPPDVTGGAYESIRNINDKVFLGQFVHGMHKWGAA